MFERLTNWRNGVLLKEAEKAGKLDDEQLKGVMERANRFEKLQSRLMLGNAFVSVALIAGTGYALPFAMVFLATEFPIMILEKFNRDRIDLLNMEATSRVLGPYARLIQPEPEFSLIKPRYPRLK